MKNLRGQNWILTNNINNKRTDKEKLENHKKKINKSVRIFFLHILLMGQM